MRNILAAGLFAALASPAAQAAELDLPGPASPLKASAAPNTNTLTAGPAQQWRGDDRRDSRQAGRNDRQDRRYDGRDSRRDQRSDRRNDGRDDRADRRDDRRDGRYGRRGDWRDHREARRDERNDRRWDSNWRRDRRYDWSDYRRRHNSVYRAGRYYAPQRDYRYSRLRVGLRIGAPFYSSRYWISHPARYRLPPAYGNYRWVRYYDDVLLVDVRRGIVVDVIYDFFW